jgi:hypothetical protein
MGIRLEIKRYLCSPLAIICLLLLLTSKGHLEIIDTDYSVRTAIAIIEEGSLLIDPVDIQVVERFPKIEGTDKVYSQYGIGLAIIFLPAVLVGKFMTLLTSIEQRILIDFILSFYNVPFALLGLYFFKSILLRNEINEKKANTCMILLFTCTAYWKYSVTDFSEITQICFLLGAVNSTLSNNSNKWKWVSLWCALLVAIKLVYLTLLPLFFVYAMFQNSNSISKKDLSFRCLHLSAFLLPIGIILALFNFLRFESIFESGYGSEASSFSLQFFKRDWFDYLFSFERGIFPFNPIVLFSFLGCFFIPKEKTRFFLFIGSIIFIWYLLMCFWKSYLGGYCWGNRLLVPIIPFCFIPFAFLPFDKKLVRISMGIVILLSLVIQASAVFTKVHETSVLRSKIYEETGLHTPPQLISTFHVFTYKLTNDSTQIPASVLGADTDSIIGLSDFESFYGFNLWPVHTLKFLGLQSHCYPLSLTLLVTVLTLLAILLHSNFKQYRNQQL